MKQPKPCWVCGIETRGLRATRLNDDRQFDEEAPLRPLCKEHHEQYGPKWVIGEVIHRGKHSVIHKAQVEKPNVK